MLSSKPAIAIDKQHFDRLMNIGELYLERTPEAAQFLLDELSRADIVSSEELPRHVVNIASSVTYRDDTTGEVHTFTLVWPVDADIKQKKISIMTPIGAALIGLSQGDGISWQTNNGEIKYLTVLKVE